ncbi:MAG: TerC family protein [Acidobacteria bacterium]|nr:TerC family protein [Acidobacteriota bacterium]
MFPFDDPNAWVALLTLIAMEIVLGIDNIIFIFILSGKLPPAQQASTRTIGLAVAMLSRLALLFSLTWIMKLTTPLLPPIAGRALTGRDLILIFGGLFLIFKATREIHHKLEDAGGEEVQSTGVGVTVAGVLGQILVVDLVFSLDSVITAVGMVDDLSIMVTAVVVSVGIMLLAAGPVSRFVDRHPTVKMLALAFLLLIGVTLIAEGWQFHVPKGYIYAATAFSVLVEMLNIRASAAAKARRARVAATNS